MGIDFDRTIGPVHLKRILISNEQCEWLNNGIRAMYGNEYPEIFSGTYNVIRLELDRLARTALEYVKYFVGKDELADDSTSSIRTLEWSEDGNQFYSLPTSLSVLAQIRSQ